MTSISTASPRVQRKRQARREAILRTAVGVVAEHGIEALTLQEIAETLDYTVGALYRYFPSKDALVAELQRSLVRGLEAATAELWQRCDAVARRAQARERVGSLLPLVATAGLYERVARVAPEQFGLLSRSLGDPGATIEDREARRVLATARPIFDRLAEAFAHAAEVGALAPGDPQQRAFGYWACLHGVVQLRKLARLEPDVLQTAALLRSILETLFRGWGAGRRAVETALALAGDPSLVALAALPPDAVAEGSARPERRRQ